MKTRFVVLTLLLLSACGGSSRPDEPGTDGDADADSDADVPVPPGFEADEPPPAGPAAWLEATVAGPAVDVTVRTRDLGALFGLSVHLTWDPQFLELASPVERSDAEALLDPARGGDAVALARSSPGDVALGGTRASPEAGEIEIDGEATLATVHLRALQAGPSRLDLTRAVLATADGALVPLPAAGGSLVTLEVTP